MDNNNENAPIVNPTNKEVVEYPAYVMDTIERLNLPHPDYEG